MLETTETGVYASLTEVIGEAGRLAYRWINTRVDNVYGVPRGGLIPAVIVAQVLDAGIIEDPALIGEHTLIVDDLVDSGHTANEFAGHHFDALYRKPHTPAHIAPNATVVDGWITFAWERNETGPEEAVVRLLEWVGEDPTREGLLETPRRVLKAMREMTGGYHESPAEILNKTFDVTSGEMIVVSGIEFSSMCEHHMLPFTGYATVAYIPESRVVGLSKIARLVDVYARRLQVQERMTDQIADAMVEHLAVKGCGVAITSGHSCMGMRGIKKSGAKMTTSALRGVFLEPAIRNEFLGHH